MKNNERQEWPKNRKVCKWC